MPRFGRDKDTTRKEELDRQAAEEVARLTRAGGPPGVGMPGMPGMGGVPTGPPSPLEQMAAEIRDAPRPSQRRVQAPRKAAPKAAQAFTPLPSGGVGSSFGPGGLNPGPRMGGAAPPPPAFGGGAYEEDYGGQVSGPPVFNAEPDEDEEMTVTEMALMDHAARTGHDPEDLVIQYDASSAEEMRDAAMRRFYERQQARRPGAATNNPFAPAGRRGGASGSAPLRANQDPAAAGGALAQRLANRRRREEEEARRARAAAEPQPAPEPRPAAPEELDDGPEETVAPGRRHASARQQSSPGLRSVPLQPVADEAAPSLDDMAASRPTRGSTRAAKKAAAPLEETAAAPVRTATTKKATTKTATTKKATAKKAPATRAAATRAAATTRAPSKKAATKKAGGGAAPSAKRAAKAPATKAAATAKAGKGTKASATLAEAPAKKAPAARNTGRTKTVFCIECGEKNPAIAKFCFNCGTRLAAPE